MILSLPPITPDTHSTTIISKIAKHDTEAGQMLIATGSNSGLVECFRITDAVDLISVDCGLSSFQLPGTSVAHAEFYHGHLYLLPARSGEGLRFDFENKKGILSKPISFKTGGLTAWIGNHFFSPWAYIPSHYENHVSEFRLDSSEQLIPIRTPGLKVSDITSPTVLVQSPLNSKDFYLAGLSACTIAQLKQQNDGALSDTKQRFPLVDNGCGIFFMAQYRGTLYAVSPLTSRVYQFRIDPDTGKLVPLVPAWVGTKGDYPVKIIFKDNYAYVINRLSMSTTSFTIDKQGGLTLKEHFVVGSRSMGVLLWKDWLIYGSSLSGRITMVRLLPDGHFDHTLKRFPTKSVPDPQFVVLP